MLPKETLSELIYYILENEEFKSIDQLGSLTQKEFREAMKDLAFYLKQESEKEQNPKWNLKNVDELSPKVKHALSTLTPRELHALIKQFGIER